MQTLDLNGVPVWNGFRSFPGSPAFSRINSQKAIRPETGGNNGGITTTGLSENAFSHVTTPDTQVEAGEVAEVKDVVPALAGTPRQTPPKLGSRQASMRRPPLSIKMFHSRELFGGSRKGACPLAGGAAVFAAWGEPARPSFPLWGNGKGE